MKAEVTLSKKRVDEIKNIYILLKDMNDLLALENQRDTKTAFLIQNAMFYVDDAYFSAQIESGSEK